MKKIYIISIVTIVVLAVLYGLYVVGGTYQNKKFGYQITIPLGWHISEIMSRKMDMYSDVSELSSSIGCNITKIVEGSSSKDNAIMAKKLQDCLESNKDFKKIEALHQSFQRNWKIENAEFVYITKMTAEEETKLTLADLSMPGKQLPDGTFIFIHPLDFVVDFTEATSSTQSGISKSFYYLSDQTKTYLADFRSSKLASSGLSLSIPINSSIEIFNGDENKQAKSISILTTAQKGSQEEIDFMDVIKSFKLIK